MDEKSIARNAPCPCGSGKKYKQCCIGKRQVPGSSPGSSRTVLISLVIAAGVILGAWAWTTRTTTPVPLTSVSFPSTDTRGGAPAPYEYDPVNNRYWHAGHGHWHDGPPPPEARRPGGAPQPYEYDAANDRHWDPDHGHWHSGPPPQRHPR